MSEDSADLDGLDLVEALVKKGDEPQITGRQLMAWFGASRRGSRVVARIQAELLRRKLVTEPDFEEVWVDVPIKVKALKVAQPEDGKPRKESDGEAQAKAPGETPPASPAQPAMPARDRTPTIGRLPAANKKVVSVPPGTPLNEAITIMMLHDYSQLPIVQNERECKGAVSWQSIATAKALGQECKSVDDCKIHPDDVLILRFDTSQIEAFAKIEEKGFALVRAHDRRFQGIMTLADLSFHVRAISEPFLLIGQIEHMIRDMIERAFTLDEIRKAKNPADTSREVNDVSDLSFGEYVGLLEPKDAWPKLKFPFDRGPFLKALSQVREIRNDVMHFDPEPLAHAEITLLQNFSVFLGRISKN